MLCCGLGYALQQQPDVMPVTISSIAAEMGLKFSANDYISIGIKVKRCLV